MMASSSSNEGVEDRESVAEAIFFTQSWRECDSLEKLKIYTNTKARSQNIK